MHRYSTVGWLAALASILMDLAAAGPSVPVAYCATINTASTSANFSTFQSDGLCYTFCNDDGYALGVVQASNCWCSDYVPGDTVDNSECESSCPGYPTDFCGGDGTFGYMKLEAAVSGTQGASSSTTSLSTSTTSSSTTSTSKSDTTVTISSLSRDTVTVTETPAQTSVTSSSSSSELTPESTPSLTSQKASQEAQKTTSAESDDSTTSPSADTTSSSSSSDDDHSTPSIVTSVKTVTSDGQVVYQTITSTAQAVAANGNLALSGGAIAGIVIGIILILLLFIAGALLYRRHRMKRDGGEGAPLAGDMAQRRGSSAGIMSKTGTMSSSGYGMGMEEETYGSHRMSMKPMDPRLDPKQTFGLYRAASHDSINTLRDDHDYSRRVHQPGRVLRVTNMDPTNDNT